MARRRKRCWWPLIAVLALLVGAFLVLLVIPLWTPEPEAIETTFGPGVDAEAFNDFAASLGCSSVQAMPGDRLDDVRALLKACLVRQRPPARG